MSIKLMSLAFDARVSNPLRKLVLLKLCDHANEKGQCWPSFSYIADQCEISRRSAINHIQTLIEDGYLSSESRFKDGEQTTNMYTISISRLIKNIADSAPPSANDAPGVVQMATVGGESPAPRTISEPSLLNISESLPDGNSAAPKKQNIDLDYSVWPELPKKQLFEDWKKVRKAKRAVITQTVIDDFGEEFRKAANFGYSVNDCLKMAVTKGWQGFKFNWMQNEISKGVYGGAHKQNNQQCGLDPDDTSWADRVFGTGSPAGDPTAEPGIQIIEGDFSSVGGGNT